MVWSGGDDYPVEGRLVFPAEVAVSHPGLDIPIAQIVKSLEENGAMGHLYFSRVSTGRKMGYAYEISGTKGAIRFDQEDQNALWLYRMEGPEATRGFTKILTGPEHPDYVSFCKGPGHGTGYQDQIIIEAKDFLTAIGTGEFLWPSFRDGHEVNRVIAATLASADSGAWKDINDF